MIAYFNGSFVPQESIRISPDDRGFLFADGLYEVIRTYGRTLFATQAHIDRLNRGAAHLDLPVRDFRYLEEVARELVEKNQLAPEATVYIQVTRGAAPRTHNFPDPATPLTVYALAKAYDPDKTRTGREQGVPAITVPDQRWARCDLKTVGLTANVLANQAAKDKGAKEALFVRDGVVLEGSHSNFMAILDNVLYTAPASNYILHGITRNLILDLCRTQGIPMVQEPLFAKDLPRVTEAFITGTTTEITPLTVIDGQPVGEGVPGPVTRTLQTAFSALVAGTA